MTLQELSRLEMIRSQVILVQKRDWSCVWQHL